MWPGPTDSDYTSLHPVHPSGRPWASKRTPDKHIISEDTARSLGYGQDYNKKYIGIDWGFTAPFACVWLEVTPKNTVFAYRELYGTEKHPVEWGREIHSMTGDEEIFMSLGK